MKILPCDPDLLPFEAMKLLHDACKKTKNNINDFLDGGGTFYLIEDNGIKGVLYFETLPGILNLAFMACPNAMQYKEFIPQFVKDLMKSLDISVFCIVSRTGWNRLFKDLTPVGMIYTYSQ